MSRQMDQIAAVMLLHGTPAQRLEALKYCAADPKIRAQVQPRRHRFWAALARLSVLRFEIVLMPRAVRAYIARKMHESAAW